MFLYVDIYCRLGTAKNHIILRNKTRKKYKHKNGMNKTEEKNKRNKEKRI